VENGAIDAAVETLKYVIEKCSDDFVIHMEITSAGYDLEIKHFLFGCVDWSLYEQTRWHSQHKFFPRASVAYAERAILESQPDDNTNIILLSNDIIYGISFAVKNEFPQIAIDLSSAVFGKGTYYMYATISHRANIWQMYSNFPRGSVYNRKKGTLYECLDLFMMSEKKMEHPYQKQIDQHPDVYTDATMRRRKFI
jgi:hypothetical protein